MERSRDDHVDWTWDGRAMPFRATRRGDGPTALLLPALSSISTREEMAPLAHRLAPHFATVAVDWPGFGADPKPRIAWTPAAMRAALDAIIDRAAPEAALVVAAGHAAGYLLEHAARRPRSGRRLALVAPTWRGPLPTMLRRRPAMLGRIARAGDLPGLGSVLYRANVNPPMVRLMARAHVYSDPAFLDGERGRRKGAVTRAAGARHAALRFVTGELDPFPDRTGMLEAASRLAEPLLVVLGGETPRKSLADMEALAASPGVAAIRLPRGKLAIHEEFPDAVAAAILAFHDRDLAGCAGRGPA